MANIGKDNEGPCRKQRLPINRPAATTTPKASGSTVISALKTISVLTFLLLLTARMLVSCIKLNEGKTRRRTSSPSTEIKTLSATVRGKMS